jgi:hypothetical protein
MQILRRAAVAQLVDFACSVPFRVRYRPSFEILRLIPLGSVRSRLPAPIANVRLVCHSSNQDSD